jgi:protein-disulfide isomerase
VKLSRLLWCSALLIWAGAIRSAAQTAPKAEQSEGITRQQADEILNELKQIHQLLEKMQFAFGARSAPPPVPATVKVSTEGYSLGSPDAPLTLVEFSDYQCPYCAQFHSQTFQELREKYIDTGKLRFVVRDLPLDIHIHALPAAQAARCGGEQGKFWEMRDILTSHANLLDPDAILAYGKQLGLDMQRFHACVDAHQFLPEISKDVAEAKSLGIGGTPSFVLGRTRKDNIEGILLVGTMPYASLDAKLRELLSTSH